jgi:hypothetical protein
MAGLVKAAQARAQQDAPGEGAGRTREMNRAATSKVLGDHRETKRIGPMEGPDLNFWQQKQLEK